MIRLFNHFDKSNSGYIDNLELIKKLDFDRDSRRSAEKKKEKPQLRARSVFRRRPDLQQDITDQLEQQGLV